MDELENKNIEGSNDGIKIRVIYRHLPRVWTGEKVPIVTGFITIGQLFKRTDVAIKRQDIADGYQREPSTIRVNRLTQQVAMEEVDLPTGVLVNLRDFESEKNLDLVLAGEDGMPSVYDLILTDEKLWVVDGQHRTSALSNLAERDLEKWRDYIIPFVGILGGSKDFELEQFYVVNSNAKSIPTNLAYQLMADRSIKIPGVFESMQLSGKAWIADCNSIVEKLATSDGNWSNRIRFAGEPKLKTTVNLSGVVNSLKRSIQSPYFGGANTESQLAILRAYWEGIHRCLPDAFVEPTSFVLQKSLGVNVMHHIMPEVIEIVRSRSSLNVIDPDSYKEVLCPPLESLSGMNVDEDTVTGSEFWKISPEGAAGAFSSSAGRRQLIARLRSGLPKIAVDIF